MPIQVKNTSLISDLSGSLQDVLDSLRKLSTRNRCIVSIKTLVKISGYTRSTVQRALKKLKEKKYIRVKLRSSKEKGNLPSCYVLIDEVRGGVI
ncbi:helix-turn-helix domain-containing protein [Candidatus Halobeggiatoa sp. HSG11]|nr:helix-turn-helix domain-containing protein [Candidatus Halobeggiatoa sp. HSG11]